MKAITKVFLFVILLGIILLNTTCGNNKLFEKVTFEGYVYDSIGGKPAQGISVGLNACIAGSQYAQCDTYEVGSTITDISGYFKIYADAARSGRYTPVVKGIFLNSSINDQRGSQLSNYPTIYLNNL